MAKELKENVKETHHQIEVIKIHRILGEKKRLPILDLESSITKIDLSVEELNTRHKLAEETMNLKMGKK